MDFAQELTTFFPNSAFIKRGPLHSLRGITDEIQKSPNNYTSLVVVNEDLNTHKPNMLTIVHFPQGPTLTFKLSNILPGKRIQNHGRSSIHIPELILNNFATSLGVRVGSLLADLFPKMPEFKGRQVVTFHNQRDFIFVRRHRYIFKDGQKVNLQEIGPRFSLKLQNIRSGTPADKSLLEYEWIRKVSP